MSADNMPPPVSIVGAGIAGGVLGCCLRKRGIPCVIYEKKAQNDSGGRYGISVQRSNMLSVLNAMDSTKDGDRSQLNSTNAQQHHVDLSTLRQRLPWLFSGKENDMTVRFSRSDLLAALEPYVDIRWGHDFQSSELSDKAVLKFKVGSETVQKETSTVIHTDGVHSRAKNYINSRSEKLQVLPYVVFRGRRNIGVPPWPERLRECFLSPEGIEHLQGNVLLRITSDGPPNAIEGDGKVSFSYTLSRPAGPADDKILKRSNSDAALMAQQFIDEASHLIELPEPFKTVFDPSLLKKDRLIHWLMRSSLIPRADMLSAARSNTVTVLLGDAAHAQPILGGRGADLAIEDAVALAEHFQENGSVDLEAFVDGRWLTWEDRTKAAKQVLHDMHIVGQRNQKL